MRRYRHKAVTVNENPAHAGMLRHRKARAGIAMKRPEGRKAMFASSYPKEPLRRFRATNYAKRKRHAWCEQIGRNKWQGCMT